MLSLSILTAFHIFGLSKIGSAFFISSTACQCPAPSCPSIQQQSFCQSTNRKRLKILRRETTHSNFIKDELLQTALENDIRLKRDAQINQNWTTVQNGTSNSSNSWMEDKEDMEYLIRVDEETNQLNSWANSGLENATSVTSKCNSLVLKKLMLENMDGNPRTSKHSINLAAEHHFGGNVDVVCSSSGNFTYIYASALFCEATHNLLTCIAFRQPSNNN